MKDRAGTHAARAQALIRERILSGGLAAGSRLMEVPMAAALAISRTPLREAMGRLAEEGLLERARGGGYVVRAFSAADALDAIEIRGVLEGTAARLAAERGAVPSRLDALRETLARLDACFGRDDEADFDGYARLNEQFHRELAGLAGSEVIAREIERVARLPFAAPSSFLIDEARPARVRQTLRPAQEQHRALLAAIEAREGARAEALAREHARIARANLEALLRAEAAPGARPAPLALIVG